MLYPPRPRVAFVVAGAQKAGTTALHHMLSALPSLFLPARKELHFFDDDSRDWHRPDYAGYEAWFRDAGPRQICGEATPAYIYVTASLDRIRAYNPAMRFIVVLRDPVARAHSHWRMQATRGLDPEPFSFAIREGRQRVRQNTRIFSYVERGFYARQIREILARFPAGQCHFLLHEDLRHAPDSELARIARFLGCSAAAPVPPPGEPPFFRSAPHLPAVSPGDESLLRGLYRDDIRETAALIGRDLSAWLG